MTAQEQQRMRQEINRQQHHSFRQSALKSPGESLPRERSVMQYMAPRDIPQHFTWCILYTTTFLIRHYSPTPSMAPPRPLMSFDLNDFVRVPAEQRVRLLHRAREIPLLTEYTHKRGQQRFCRRSRCANSCRTYISRCHHFNGSEILMKSSSINHIFICRAAALLNQRPMRR